MTEKGIGTMIYYQIPVHQQKPYAEFATLHLPIPNAIHREAISIQMDPRMTDGEVDRVMEAYNTFA